MINLNQFLGEEGCYKINRIWVQDGYENATDGRIIVCEKTDKPSNYDGSFPDATKLLFGKDFSQCVNPFPAAERSTETECQYCSGSGEKTEECPTCGHDRATGEDCERCDGLGMSWKSATIGGCFYSGYYLNKIATLPYAKYSDKPDHNGTLLFVFDGGRGLLMKMTEEVK